MSDAAQALTKPADHSSELPETGEASTDTKLPAEIMIEQDADLQQYALTFLTKVLRLRGVRIDRDSFLRQELRKLYLDDVTIEIALASTPLQAGITPEQLSKLANQSISFETNKSSAASFVSGLPGGWFMAATIPADITQFYMYAFRIMQKLAYLYGWQNFIDDLDEIDDYTLNQMATFLGVMMGVSGASTSLKTFATRSVQPAVSKQIASKAFTNGTIFPIARDVLRMIGVKLTKKTFANGLSKLIPLAGGFISSGLTFATLRRQSNVLHNHLKETPPPGMDAAEFHRLISDDAAAGAADRVVTSQGTDASED